MISAVLSLPLEELDPASSPFRSVKAGETVTPTIVVVVSGGVPLDTLEPRSASVVSVISVDVTFEVTTVIEVTVEDVLVGDDVGGGPV